MDVPHVRKTLLERLDEGVVICGEGYLFELERRGWVSVGAFVPEVVLEHPTAVEELHREFLRAGSDVIEAFTYYGKYCSRLAVSPLFDDLSYYLRSYPLPVSL